MSDDDLIGPALPPMFRPDGGDDSDDDKAFAGPALPPGYKPEEPSTSSEESEPEEVVFKRSKASGRHAVSTDGPIANKLRRVEDPEKTPRDEEDDGEAGEDDDGFFGPALPPGFQKQQSSPERPPVLGPALPPGFRRTLDEEEDEEGQGMAWPTLPPGYRPEASSSDGEPDEDVIGPMPWALGGAQGSVAEDFERRALRMKEKLIGGEGPQEVARETWMTELPPELQHIGLGARTFKKRTGPASKDRSIWTDTPADRERKARERLEGKKSEEEDKPKISFKELQMAEKVSKYNETKRGESLVSLHTQKLKRKAKQEEAKPVERRPFDRDNDLQANRFDEAQKKALLKKSQELNTRFSHSKEKMFL